MDWNHFLIKENNYYNYEIKYDDDREYTHFIYSTKIPVLLEIFNKQEFNRYFLDAQEERKIKLDKLNEGNM